MVTPEHVTESKAIQRETGATFHLATRLLPERTRRATYVLYAFFRVADDVVDDPDPAPQAEQRRELEEIRAAAKGDRDTDDPVLSAFDAVRREYGISDEEIDVFVDAMLMDVDPAEFATTADLSTYLRGSSVAVANMLLAVMDPPEADEARPRARALAEAFQLTNFVRDVREDVIDYDRVYIPREVLDDHGLSPADVRDLSPSDALSEAVADELSRTEDRYREGVAGISYLPEDCQFAVLLAATLYAEHHRLIRARGFDVVSGRPTLSHPRRLWVLARTWYHWRRTGDPEATFYAVSPVDRTPAGDAAPGDRASPDHAGSRPSGVLSRTRRTLGGWTTNRLRRVGSVVPWREE